MLFKGCEIFLAKNLRGLRMTREILRGLKIFPSENNKGCETIRAAKRCQRVRVMKFSSARGVNFFDSHLNKCKMVMKEKCLNMLI